MDRFMDLSTSAQARGLYVAKMHERNCLGLSTELARVLPSHRRRRFRVLTRCDHRNRADSNVRKMAVDSIDQRNTF